ncbi:unnamed protein product (macronuclear) [Paramecium tetraurelia]|uniref:Response regulatory domain-containing protein n=1 Tax=Paramecium tetraurelia TaxID=5888 RepID=A0CS10_PARTE|nr:uncharacterized protein GSPATT00009849001 [Paramecium tetraurelia]CAK73577.1 unnamed protein product [Paramecium tetraurelia]|eukprot:XP_001440974.1 hypothetical protein (macronuclear) [Paramecium tetraurelia strain d4-2]
MNLLLVDDSQVSFNSMVSTFEQIYFSACNYHESGQIKIEKFGSCFIAVFIERNT